MSSFSGIGKILTCWKLFIKYVHLLSGVGRGDNVAGAWTFECSLYVIEENDVKGFDDAWHGLFVEAKRDIEMLPQTHGTLELHIIRVNMHAGRQAGRQEGMHAGRQAGRQLYMHACMQTDRHTYIHTYIRTYVRTYVRTYIHTYIRTYVRTYVRTYRQTYR